MANDDLTQKLPEDDRTDKTTQPIIEQLVVEIRALRNDVAGLNARFDSVDARIDRLESRLARDIEGVNARINEVAADMASRFIGIGNKLEALNRSRLQSEGDYFNLAQRVTDLESKVR